MFDIIDARCNREDNKKCSRDAAKGICKILREFE